MNKLSRMVLMTLSPQGSPWRHRPLRLPPRAPAQDPIVQHLKIEPGSGRKN